MKKHFLLAFFLLTSLFLNAQVMLNRIGQTPGGAAYSVNYDSLNQRLIVGCGTAIWIYDVSDTSNYHVIAKRSLLGLVNETSVYGNVLFVAATHHGVFALDYNSDSLSVIHHYNMQNTGDSAAYGMFRSNDTLFVADSKRVRMLKYSSSTGFSLLTSFGNTGAFCVARRHNMIAVGCQGIFTPGKISVYDLSDLSTPLATWSSNTVQFVQDLQFADLRDDIIYICGGPEQGNFDKSDLVALQINGNTLAPVDTFSVVNPIPIITTAMAHQNIMNMDSRNDTLFPATTCSYSLSTIPLSYVPVIDATALPTDTMKQIGYILSGLWYFDNALMDGTPYMAIASEWCGVLVSNVSNLQPDDTLGLYPTGGWCTRSQIHHDTLWACHEGYGLVAYKLDSLYFSHGYMTNSKLLHIYTQFVADFDFINDTLLILSSQNGEIYNIKPWLQGTGSPVLTDSLKISGILRTKTIQTTIGTRILVGRKSGYQKIMLVNPANPSVVLDTIDISSNALTNEVNAFDVKKDTLFCCLNVSNNYYLAMYLVSNDSFTFLDSIAIPPSAGIINSISIENNTVVIGCNMNVKCYTINGNSLTEGDSYFDWFINAGSVKIKNNLVYVTDKFYGLQIIDFSQPTPTVVAKFRGTGGWSTSWMTVFGGTDVNVGDDGQIYLSDFNAGVIIIQTYDTTLSESIEEPNLVKTNNVRIYPNPASDQINVELIPENNTQYYFEILSIKGQLVNRTKISRSFSTVNTKAFANGTYLYQVKANNNVMSTGKIIINK